MSNCKTPVSVLQELCAKKGVTPVYDTVGQEGNSHQPIFTIRCITGSLVGTGQGPSKKIAKQSAAEDLLHQLNVDVSDMTITRDHESCDVSDNPVGDLQEFVTRRGLRKPEYEATAETGPAHDRRFIISCTVGKYQKEGCEKNKKLAKRRAAQIMLEFLQSVSIEADDEVELEALSASRAKSETRSPRRPNKANLSNLANLPFATGRHITRLRSCYDYHPGGYDMLSGLSNELKFEVEYTTLPDLNLDGHYQCMVTMTTSPVSVNFAAGETEEIARINATTNALKYLKVMATRITTNS